MNTNGCGIIGLDRWREESGKKLGEKVVKEELVGWKESYSTVVMEIIRYDSIINII